jgi:GNAT superfamily N-acetyltransferase
VEARLIDVTPERGRADRRAFIELPYRLYRDDPLWVPPLRRDVAHMLDPHHPFHRHAEVELFLARDGGGRVVGRIAAIKNDAHTAQHHDGVGFFGFFESERNPEVAAALFATAAAWLAARGLTVMRGPASFSVNEECGLLVKGFDSSPVVMMPYNPPWYADLVEGYGFTKAKDLIAYRHEATELPDRLARIGDRLAARNQITIRTLDMKQFTAEVDRVRMLYNAAWEANWGNIPMTDAEFDDLAKQLKPVVRPELVLFAEVRGELAGFALALPDLNVALRHMNGHLLPFGWAFGLWYGRNIKAARVLTLGVLPKFRLTGAAELLTLGLYKNGFARGIYEGESSWILEDNLLMRQAIETVGGDPYKTYRLYDKTIRPQGQLT